MKLLKVWKNLSDGWCILEKERDRSYMFKWKSNFVSGYFDKVDDSDDVMHAPVEKDTWILCSSQGGLIYKGHFIDCLNLYYGLENGDLLDLITAKEIGNEEQDIILEKLLG